jgi:hypothetical protein
MVTNATPPRSGTRHRGSLRAPLAALCCGLLLSGPAVATATAATPSAATAPTATATAPDAQAQVRHHRHGRGTLVSAEKLYTLATPRAVAAELAAAGFGDDTVRTGVVAYRLVYRTVDAHGRPTTASGLFVLPLNREKRLRAVSFAHGTAPRTSWKTC